MIGKYLYLLILTGIFICCESKTHFEKKYTRALFEGQGLQNVESVLYDHHQQILYITNGLDYIPGTDGFISKASSDGENLELNWVTDLNRPTGMALKGNTLYVADLFELLAINTESGEITERFKEPISGSALNDVTIDNEGNIYVSASRIGAIFKLVDGELKLWAQDKTRLKYANGLLVQNDQLLIAGFNLNSVDLKSRQLTERITEPSIKDMEGLVSDGKDGYFLTTVGKSSLYHLTKNLEAIPLLIDSDYFGDPTYDQKNSKLFVPRGNEDTEEYYITVLELMK